MRRYRAAEEAKAEREHLRGSRAEAQALLALGAIAQRLQRQRAAHQVTGDRDEAIGRRIGILKALHPDWDRERCYNAALSELE